MRKMSPEAMVLLASSAPTKRIFPLDEASAMNTWVIVSSPPPPEAGKSMFDAFDAVCVSVESAAIVVQPDAATC